MLRQETQKGERAQGVDMQGSALIYGGTMEGDIFEDQESGTVAQ